MPKNASTGRLIFVVDSSTSSCFHCRHKKILKLVDTATGPHIRFKTHTKRRQYRTHCMLRVPKAQTELQTL